MNPMVDESWERIERMLKRSGFKDPFEGQYIRGLRRDGLVILEQNGIVFPYYEFRDEGFYKESSISIHANRSRIALTYDKNAFLKDLDMIRDLMDNIAEGSSLFCKVSFDKRPVRSTEDWRSIKYYRATVTVQDDVRAFRMVYSGLTTCKSSVLKEMTAYCRLLCKDNGFRGLRESIINRRKS